MHKALRPSPARPVRLVDGRLGGVSGVRYATLLGPGVLVGVGYMDPGNWATGVAAGSAFGYDLLFVVIGACLLALFLQLLSAKLGVVSGLDLAQACRRLYPQPLNLALWVLCEFAIVACDLAEVLGAAVALKLLFGLPLLVGVVLTGVEVMLILALQGHGLKRLEAFVVATSLLIAGCLVLELVMSPPIWSDLLRGLAPSRAILTDHDRLYLAAGIVGATVMPHNLYLHSAIVKGAEAQGGVASALKRIRVETVIALTFAAAVNAAILILAATALRGGGLGETMDLEAAHGLLAPAAGAGLAGVLFAVALLASGHNAALTGTLAGQIVMEGFLDTRMAPWARRVLSRALAIVPAVAVIAAFGESAAGRLLVFSQVALSLQLPFALGPLVHATSSRRLMGRRANRPATAIAASLVTVLVVALNVQMTVRVLG